MSCGDDALRFQKLVGGGVAAADERARSFLVVEVGERKFGSCLQRCPHFARFSVLCRLISWQTLSALGLFTLFHNKYNDK